ncbi:epimerase [Tessaracoccus sp. OS52]|uniref:NAD-dependent epimerase/dehydratase family protein n=1 Tax=Tessaracoccus sp. OS52 TaxID=2886691 RepID=UPI001D12BA1E|nr:NAD-dependent epimerase/dehydratase family protein [Tessaracoccus sp. OS52]MCC2593859.1 epimerase [Tessaracoccus sp. OS52]
MQAGTRPAPQTEDELDEVLSRPTAGVVEQLRQLDGDLVLLGGGGKVGPTLAMMARRALDEIGSSHRVISVSRWSDERAAAALREAGVELVSADLSNPDAWTGLPDAAAAIYLLGHKFGSASAPSLTWWLNAVVPGFCAARYRGVPTVVYSTGNVYPLRETSTGGSFETDPVAPVGTYAQSCAAREQAFLHAAGMWDTPTLIYRLNYAVELRYGVIADIAGQLAAGQPVDVTMPAVNVVWQADSNAWTLQSLGLTGPEPTILNATGPETLSTRWITQQLAERGGWEPRITGTEAPTALLSNAAAAHGHFGYPTASPLEIIDWVAQWVSAGGRQLGKPTKFQQREGSF